MVTQPHMHVLNIKTTLWFSWFQSTREGDACKKNSSAFPLNPSYSGLMFWSEHSAAGLLIFDIQVLYTVKTLTTKATWDHEVIAAL